MGTGHEKSRAISPYSDLATSSLRKPRFCILNLFSSSSGTPISRHFTGEELKHIAKDIRKRRLNEEDLRQEDFKKIRHYKSPLLKNPKKGGFSILNKTFIPSSKARGDGTSAKHCL